MAGPPNKYRTLRTINTLLISGTGFSIAAKAKKKKEDKREEIMGNYVDMLNSSYSPQQWVPPNWVNNVKGQQWESLCCQKRSPHFVTVVKRLSIFLFEFCDTF